MKEVTLITTDSMDSSTRTRSLVSINYIVYFRIVNNVFYSFKHVVIV